MTKAELRKIYKAQRLRLTAEAVELASEQICRQFQAFINGRVISGKPTSLHVFLPVQSQNEVNTWPIINWLWQVHPTVSVLTSVANFRNHALTHFALTPQTELTTNRYGIPQPDPVNGVPVPASAIDVVLVPLLIFDRQGHRVGYGSGFYDRFLADCRPDCLKIGLSMFEPVEYLDDINGTDIALDGCITPDGTNWF